MTFRLLAEGFEIDPPGLAVSEWYQAQINVQATFKVIFDDRVFIEETSFCVVELAHALSIWETKTHMTDAFYFSSMDEEEEGLLWFEPAEQDKWLVGSVLRKDETEIEVTESQLAHAVAVFKGQVESSVKQELGIGLRSFEEFV